MHKDVIVLLYYNKLKLTRTCVESVLQAGYTADRIFLFDNGSKKDVYDELTQAFPLCNHLRVERNGGYSAGFNRSLEWVFSKEAESALFLTNDTHVFPGALEACLKTASETGVGMVAPCITYMSDNNAIDSIGGFFDEESCLLNHYRDRDLPVLLDTQRDYIPGTALWVNKEFFERLEGTDESYHMYWEDVDICFRANRLGMGMARCYEARIGHGVGRTCRKKPLYTTFYFHRNRIRFCKNYLSGAKLEAALQLLKRQLLGSGETWREREDRKRLNYLAQLLEELENPPRREGVPASRGKAQQG
ncbi:MAG: glycosyltransferase family 2 protein [bacterium]|nr:glycosyltransferase family 2 protein [bacterium]